MSKLRTVLIFMVSILVSQTSWAHPGHGEPGTLFHELNHATWLLAGSVLLYVLLVRVVMLLAKMHKVRRER